MKHPQGQIDPKEIVSRVALPYSLPVDFIVRGFLIFLTAILVCVVYKFLIDITAPTPMSWIIVGVIACGLVYFQLRPGGISIHEDEIEIRRNFFWFTRFRWSDIEKVQTGTQTQLGISDPFRGPYIMVITLAGSDTPILLNIKPYSAKGLSILTAFLVVRAINAEIDKRTAAMIDRRFPSLFVANGQKGI
ncbi:MAG: hypothetical protein MUF81_03815 [Verrucomicrobia bacterium]|jgi:hypothetical protein|nr:hypothetical protein [Verrucomicrobiota bacterium]